MKKLFNKKSIPLLLQEAQANEHGLKKTLGMWSLIALGVCAIICAGLFFNN